MSVDRERLRMCRSACKRDKEEREAEKMYRRGLERWNLLADKQKKGVNSQTTRLVRIYEERREGGEERNR